MDCSLLGGDSFSAKWWVQFWSNSGVECSAVVGPLLNWKSKAFSKFHHPADLRKFVSNH
jgi:hypothetical protein